MTEGKHSIRRPILNIESKIGSPLNYMYRIENKNEWLISGNERFFIVENSGTFKEINESDLEYVALPNNELRKGGGSFVVPWRMKKAQVEEPGAMAIYDPQLHRFVKSARLRVGNFTNNRAENDTFKDNPVTEFEVLRLVEGFESDTNLSELLQITKLPQTVLANDIFELTPKTFAKYKTSSEKVPSRISELAVKLKELFIEGVEVFGNTDEFNKWLKEPSLGLNDRIPLKILNTTTGIDLVYRELLKIEFGITA